jgi:NAD-dependent oxidoreductase involved in siderophore biosynthesis
VVSGAPIRVAVLGSGRIGSLHAELLAQRIPGAELAAVLDADDAIALRVAGALGVPTATLDDVFTAPDIDAVAVCTSTDTHVELVERAADAGKAVFCEKPVSLELPELDRALAAVDRAGVLCRSASTAASTRRTGQFETPSPRARSASRIWCVSRAETPSRRRSTTCACRVASSST